MAFNKSALTHFIYHKNVARKFLFENFMYSCSFVFMFYFVHTVSIVTHTWCTYSDVFLLINMCSKNVMSQSTQRLTKMLSPYQLSRSCQCHLVTKAKYISPTHIQYEETLRNLLKIKSLGNKSGPQPKDF